MITFKQAKKNALKKIENIKTNAYYEIFCIGCSEIKQMKVFTQGRQNTFCSNKCRQRVFIKNKKQKHNNEIAKLKQRIKELENV